MALRHEGSNFRSRLTLHPLALDLGLTAAVEFSVLVAGLLTISLFSRMLGPILLGEYLLLRRVYTFMDSGALLGLGGALTRYVAHSVDKPASERTGYLTAALAYGTSVVFGLVVVLNAASGSFGRWLFGSGKMTHLIFPLSLLLMGGTGNNLVYAYYRGRLAMKRANALQFCNLVLVPLVAVAALARASSVDRIVSVMGVSMLVICAMFAVPLIPDLAIGVSLRLRRYAAELFHYGIPRLPGGFGQGVLFSLGPIVAAHYMPVEKISYLLLGTSMLMGVAASAHPLGLVLLSKASMVVAQNRLAEVKVHFEHLQVAVVELYVFACLQLVVFADVLVRVWVGSWLLEGIVIIRVVLLAVPFYLLYVSQRSIIDAISIKSYNTYNVLAAAGVFLALLAIDVKTMPLRLLLDSIAAATVAGVVVLAWLTNLTVQKLYDLRVEWSRSVVPLLLGVLLGGTSLFMHWSNGYHTGLGQFLLIELATGALFLLLLKRWGSPWIPFFWNLAFPLRAQTETGPVEQRSREN